MQTLEQARQVLDAGAEILVAQGGEAGGHGTAGGDDTYRMQLYDVVRQPDWLSQYNERTLGNSFVDGWHGNEAELLSSLADAVSTFETASAAEDFEVAAIFVGEAIGRFDKIRPAAEIVVDMATEAYRIVNRDNGVSGVSR